MMALPFSMPESYSRSLFSHLKVIGAQMESNQPEGLCSSSPGFYPTLGFAPESYWRLNGVKSARRALFV